MIAAWNEHMAKIFLAAWVVCLDKSMSIWHNRWTCPGWVFCPRKPHPFGNEYHTACCGLSGILFSMELVEGKDHPPQIQERWSDLGRTTGLLMRMLSTYFTTGRYVVLDSGFCVLRALIELKKVGLFACAVIKKQRYWPEDDGNRGSVDCKRDLQRSAAEVQRGRGRSVTYLSVPAAVRLALQVQARCRRPQQCAAFPTIGGRDNHYNTMGNACVLVFTCCFRGECISHVPFLLQARYHAHASGIPPQACLAAH